MVRGREVDALGTATLETDGLVIAWPPAAAWRLDLEGIDGVALANASLTVYLREHDVLSSCRVMVHCGRLAWHWWSWHVGCRK